MLQILQTFFFPFLFFFRLKFYQYQMHTLFKGDILRETTSAHTIQRIPTQTLKMHWNHDSKS